MSLSQLKGLLISASKIGAKKAMIDLGLYSATLNKSQAARICGSKELLARWIKEGVINPVRDASGNAAWRIDRIELESALESENRHTFLNAVERNAK
ncbi:hypothetical protein [Pedobacter nyackensis]|nr:hypothetical protein [Pedobacter nyackensis]